MATRKSNDPRRIRHKSPRHRGIMYRLRDGGLRTYYVYAAGTYVAAGGTEKEALAKQAELRGKAARGERVIVATKATFEEVGERWYESKHRLRRRTKENYRSSLDNVLLPRFGKKKIGAVTVDHIAALIRDLEKGGAAPSTINNHLLPLQGTFAFAIRRGLIGTNPYSLLTRDDRPAPREKVEAHVWSDDEIKALIEAAEHLAKQPEARQNYAPLIRTLLFTGLRIGELLGLRWQDVDLTNGVFHVREQWTRAAAYEPTKTASSVRRVPLSAGMTKCLAALKLRSTASGDGDPVFATRTGTPLQYHNVRGRGFVPAAKLAGLDVSIHDTRHAFASRMIARGIDVVTLSGLLGHRNPRVTLEVYSHLYDRQKTDDAIREAMEA
jgi:integrase